MQRGWTEKLAMTTAAKKNKKKKNPCEESWGVVELLQAMMVLTSMYKLILCMVSDVCAIRGRTDKTRDVKNAEIVCFCWNHLM